MPLFDLIGYLQSRGTYTGVVESHNYSASGIVADICFRAGLDYDMYDVSQIEGYVNGYLTSSEYAAFMAIRDIAQIMMFDPANYDGKLHFIHRGADPVAAITSDELLSGEDYDSRKKRKDGVVPRVVNFQYYDLDGELDPDMQVSDRSIYLRENSEVKVSSPVIMGSDDAARSVTVIHRAMLTEQDGEIEFSLTDDYIRLVPSDVITLDGDRYRIAEVELDDGQQNYRAIRDRKSNWSSVTTGELPNIPSVIPQDPGLTTIEILDIPPFRAVDDRLGYYVAIAGGTTAWVGAQVELSTDGGSNYNESTTSTVVSTMGILNLPIATHSRYVPDYQNTIEVTITNPNVDLETATFTEMLNRNNRAILGDEIISFSGATETTEGVWELTGLLRGRLYTDPVAHSPGERFVLLESQYVSFIDMEPQFVGDTLFFRATSLNSSNQNVVSELISGESQIEPPPGYLRARRSGGNLIISWIGTGVKGGKTTVLMSDNFTGYRVTVNSTVTDTTNETLTVTDPGGAVTIKVQQLNSITGAGDIAQIIV